MNPQDIAATIGRPATLYNPCDSTIMVMPRQSAGLLLYRVGAHGVRDLEVFLVHPGGPFWAKKDLGAWSIPKGEYAADEDTLAAAIREFREETGFAVAEDLRREDFLNLGVLRQSGGKLVSVWALDESKSGVDCDPAALVSNRCEIEWPPRSGRRMEIPEVDRGAWFSLDEARQRILASQQQALDWLLHTLAERMNRHT
jgi:predicted NUDIX family NTP pyrophosphohydrolase